jgi:hypothetical protein
MVPGILPLLLEPVLRAVSLASVLGIVHDLEGVSTHRRGGRESISQQSGQDRDGQTSSHREVRSRALGGRDKHRR